MIAIDEVGALDEARAQIEDALCKLGEFVKVREDQGNVSQALSDYICLIQAADSEMDERLSSSAGEGRHETYKY